MTVRQERTVIRPGFLPAAVVSVWDELDRPSPSRPLDRERLSDLPDPVARWLDHVVGPGAMAHTGIRLDMHGELKVGNWLPFTAQQILSPDGYIWAAVAGSRLMRIKGYDVYNSSQGRMDWRIHGLIPVVRVSGEDPMRSAAGRLAVELPVLTPANALPPLMTWEATDDHTATATVTTGRFTHRVGMRIDDGGRAEEASLMRWGDPDRTGHREVPFGVVFTGEKRFGDYLLPESVVAGWWQGTDRWDEGEMFRCRIDHVEFF